MHSPSIIAITIQKKNLMTKKKPYSQSNYTTTKLMNADIPNEWKLLNQRTYLNTFFIQIV